MIIFVGDTPSTKMQPCAKPFKGATCEERLKGWMKALEFPEYHKVINQIDTDWTEMYSWSVLGHKFIALGNNASKALGSIPHFKLPHPSGRNRQINDKEFIARKLTECNEWLING